eukprot:scaffold23273_cov72-Phaeocystis_antarctica.AAC.2
MEAIGVGDMITTPHGKGKVLSCDTMAGKAYVSVDHSISGGTTSWQQCGDQGHTYSTPPGSEQWVLVAKHIDRHGSNSSNPTRTTGTEYSVFDLAKFENGKLFSADWHYSATQTQSRGGVSGDANIVVRFVAGNHPTLQFGEEMIECSALRQHGNGADA